MNPFFFYNNRKPRSFKHDPIYSDPRKEALMKKVEAIKKEIGVINCQKKKESDFSSLKGNFINGTTYLKRKKSGKQNLQAIFPVTISIILLVVILLLIKYLSL